MQWTKFRDDLPESPYVYVTDWSSTWPFYMKFAWDEYADENPDYAWSPIPRAEVPEEPENLHLCEEGILRCFEMPSKGLFLVAGIEIEEAHYSPVNFCPICGYETED